MGTRHVFKIIGIMWGLLALMMISFNSFVYATDSIIFSPTEKPYNISYSDHAKQFWKWQFSMPANNDHPIINDGGRNCANGQTNSSSPVFYLSGVGGGNAIRTCEVPKDKGILIPVMTVVASPNEYSGFTFDQIQGVVRGDQDSVQFLDLTMDNQTFKTEDLLKYRTMPTSAFAVNYLCCPTLFAAEEGPTSLASADGYYIITKPLSPGQHMIHFKSGLGDSPSKCKVTGTSQCSFVQDIKYNLNVK
jgi:hypothetical protein